MYPFRGFLLLIILASIVSCATHKKKYARDVENWKSQQPEMELKKSHSVFLIGDAGKKGEIQTAVLSLMRSQLEREVGKKTVVYLGDNIYPSGLPPKDYEKKRAAAEANLLPQLQILDGMDAKVFALAGNHDWGYGREGLNRQENFWEDYFDLDDVFLPKAGKGDVEDIDLSDNLVLILLDSEWYIRDWDGDPEINKGSEIKSREAFWAEFIHELKKHRSKDVIVAFHHPLVSGGPHGGYFPINDILFPLRDLNSSLFVPIPLIGPVLRANLGLSVDISHKRYTEFVEQVNRYAAPFDNVVLASGHEHNLQMGHTLEGIPQIVSGSGAKRNPVKVGGNVEFGIGEGGFVQLDVYENGEMWASFYAINQKSGKELVYRTQVVEAADRKFEEDFPIYEKHLDSITVTVYDSVYSPRPSKLQKWLWGDLHRELYYTPVKVPVLDIEQYNGGLSVGRRGGGNQTNSLRLLTDEGSEYVLRSVRKDGSRILNGVIEGTIFVEMVKDVFTFSHPFAAFSLPPMADAVNVYHTNPKLFFVPKQPALKHHNGRFGDQLYLLEERPDEDMWPIPSFGGSDEILSVPDAEEEIMKSHKHKMDNDWLMRSRFFDYVIGDWDRHEDQWRMATFEKEDYTLMRPIPRDRDQPYSKFDGILLNIINKTSPLARQFQSFGPEFKNPNWGWNYARYFDGFFLVRVNWEVWERQVREIQENLTDEIIESTIKDYPPQVFEEGGEEIVRYIKERRDGLMDEARRYYDQLNTEIHLPATQKDNIIRVQRAHADSTHIRIYHKKEKESKIVLDRWVETDVCKKIFIYGLEGDDHFYLNGDVKDGPEVYFIGGLGEDYFQTNGKVHGWGNHTFIYDSEYEENILEINTDTRDKQSKVYNDNVFNHHEFPADYGLFLPNFRYDLDDAILFGLSYSYTNYQFKRKPYGQKHTFGALFNFATTGLEFEYNGEYNRAMGRWDILTDAQYQSNQFTRNFFGFGNESKISEEVDKSFNRVRVRGADVQFSLRRKLSPSADFTWGLSGDYKKVLQTGGRVVDQPTDDSGINPFTFEDVIYGGTFGRFTFDSRSSKAHPLHGLLFRIELQGRQFLQPESNLENHATFTGEFGIYQALNMKKTVVLASRSFFQHIEGDFLFYHTPSLGGSRYMRGFRQNRFLGQTAFAQSTDLRWDAFSFQNAIGNFDMGLFASFDFGRVWTTNDNSRLWHTSYGGGVSFNVLKNILFTIGYHRGEGNNRFLIGGGYNF